MGDCVLTNVEGFGYEVVIYPLTDLHRLQIV